jgi:sulfite exporter TauE/SafE
VSPVVVSAFLMGLFGGVHCVAMCGGVVGVLCSAAPRCPTADASRRGSSSKLSAAPYWLAYNGGRVASYALLGLLFGTLGTLSTGVFPLDGVRFALRAVAAVCMLAVGLHLAGLPSGIEALESLGAPLWQRLSPVTKRFLPLRTPWHALVLGALWGMMPCGLLYGALALAASAESPVMGAATMAAFGVATLPVMLTMGALAQTVTRWLARAWVRRAAGAVVLAFGLWSTAGVAAQTGVGAAFGLGPPHHHCCPTR